MEAGRYYRTVFLGVLQAFDKIWHEGLLYKIKNNFLIDLDAIIRSYLLHCTFRIKYGEVWIKSGVPQGIQLFFRYFDSPFFSIHLWI